MNTHTLLLQIIMDTDYYEFPGLGGFTRAFLKTVVAIFEYEEQGEWWYSMHHRDPSTHITLTLKGTFCRVDKEALCWRDPSGVSTQLYDLYARLQNIKNTTDALPERQMFLYPGLGAFSVEFLSDVKGLARLENLLEPNTENTLSEYVLQHQLYSVSGTYRISPLAAKAWLKDWSSDIIRCKESVLNKK